MSTRIPYAVAVLAAVATLALAAAAPGITAEKGGDLTGHGTGAGDGHYEKGKHHGKHMAIMVEGFEGSVPAPDRMDIESYDRARAMATVTLSEAASGLDVVRGELGIVSNEDGERFLAWSLLSMEKEDGSDTVTATVHIVDAGDASNTAVMTHEFDASYHARHGDHGNDGSWLYDPEAIEAKIQKMERWINEGTGESEADAVMVQVIYNLRQLQAAIADGDGELADSLRERLSELREQMMALKGSG